MGKRFHKRGFAPLKYSVKSTSFKGEREELVLKGDFHPV